MMADRDQADLIAWVLYSNAKIVIALAGILNTDFTIQMQFENMMAEWPD